MSKEQYLSKIASVIQGINYGKDTDEASLKRIANSLESVTKEQEKSIIEILSGGSGGGCVPTTYAELKSLRDSSQLSPGTLYRITDYVATTVQEGTKSANHPFDIVVVALDEKTLSEDAGAIAHSEEDLAKYKSVTWTDASGTHTAPFLMEANIIIDGGSALCTIFAEDEDTWVLYNIQYAGGIITNLPTENVEKTEDGYLVIGDPELDYIDNYTIDSGYFAYSNLPAWQLKYCLDNDADRFIWAKAPIPATPADPGTYPATQVRWRYDPGSVIYRRTPDDDMELNGTLYYGWRYVNNSSRKLGLDDPTIQWNDLGAPPVYTLTNYVRKGTSPFYNRVDDTMEPDTNPIIRLSSIPCPAEPGGKGVIYWMKDEHNNEAPFDFKGILFSIPAGNLNSSWLNAVFPDVSFESIDLYYLSCVVTSGQELTFDNVKDASTLQQFYNESRGFLCQNNIEKQTLNMGSYLPHSLYYIPVNVIVNTNKENGYAMWLDNYFNNCSYNFIGNNCKNITLYGYATMGFITNQCNNITINNCTNYYIGSNCYNIDITDAGDAQITCEEQVCDVRVLPGVYGEVTIPMESSVQMRYVGVDSNNDLKIWNPADTAPQTS